MSARLRSLKLPQGYALLGLALIACLGIAMELYLTRNGVGTNGDSVQYLNGAQNMLAGHGYSRSRGDGSYLPINTFPPAFPIALAAISLFGSTPFDAARYLGVFLFGANVFLTGWIIFRQTKSMVFTAAGALLAVTAINLVKSHAWAMSENQYIFFSLLVLLVFQTYEKRRSRRWIILGGAFASLAVLTRYVGVSLLGTGVLVFLFLDRGKIKDRLGNAILYGASGSFLVAIWFIRNSLESNTLVNKLVGVYRIKSDLVEAFFQEIVSWVAPNQLNVPYGLAAAVLAGLVLVLVVLYWRSAPLAGEPGNGKSKRWDYFQGVVSLYLLVYFVVLVLNSLVLDGSTDTASVRRFLIPMFPVLLIWILGLFSRIWYFGSTGRTITSAAMVLSALIFVFYAYRTVTYVRNPGTTFGYTDDKRSWVGVVSTLKSISPDRPIIASDYELVLFLAERPPYSVPLRYNDTLAVANADYSQNMQITRDLLKQGAVLVAIGNPQSYDRAVNGLAANLEIWKEYSEARFYVDPSYLNQP